MTPVRQCVTVLLGLAVLGAAQPVLRIDATDPARNLAPVRLFVTTRAGAVDVTVANASIASYRSSIVLLQPGSVRVARPPSRLVLAQFHPWYPNLAAWNDSDLAGRPLRR